MRVYAIKDEELENRIIGYLFCYEKAREGIIELCSDLNEWDAPILFEHLVREGIYTVPRNITMLWIRERVIPSGRQNIGLILKNAKLTEYDELALLAISKGRCSQDECYIEEISIEEISEEIAKRRNNNILGCFISSDMQLMCTSKDDTVRKLDISSLAASRNDLRHVIATPELMNSVNVGLGGYSVTFSENIEIQLSDILKYGVKLPISAIDFRNYITIDIIDTTTACKRLGCTRQNLSYLVKREEIKPVISGAKENFYARGEIEEILNG